MMVSANGIALLPWECFGLAVIRPASGLWLRDRLYGEILKNSEPPCINIRKFLNHVYEFCLFREGLFKVSLVSIGLNLLP